MAFLIFWTLFTYAFFPKLTNAIPASLAAIIVSTILEWGLIRPIGYETTTVKDLASVSVCLNSFDIGSCSGSLLFYENQCFSYEVNLELIS